MDNEKTKKMKEAENELFSKLYKESQEHKGIIPTALKEYVENNDISIVEDTKKPATKKKKETNVVAPVEFVEPKPKVIKQKQITEETQEYDDLEYEVDEYDVPYDLIPLPSKGQIYKGVKSKIEVAYLTASDEDLITSPNLYADGKIIDVLLRKKILNKDIYPEDLCRGDRDAIIIWLRASGYGEMFKVNVNDKISGSSFESEIDLSKLKINDFKLKSDSDGYFDFKLPKTGHDIKFKFLSHKDEAGYTKYLEKTNETFKKASVNGSYRILKTIIDAETNIDQSSKLDLSQALDVINDYLESIDTENNKGYLKNVTYLLEKSIVSINGNTNKSFIVNYVKNMPAFDSRALRSYIAENTPSVDFRVTVQRPESLGGGSMDTFLELDSSIFLNIS